MAPIHIRLIALAGLVVPIVGIMAPRGLAATLIITAVLVGGAYAREARRWPPIPSLPAVLLVLLLGWGAVSALWNVSAAETLTAVAKLAALAAGGMGLVAIAAGMGAADRTRLRRAVAIGSGLAIALLASEELTHGFLSQALRDWFDDQPVDSLAFLNMAVCVGGLMIWPAVIALAEGRGRPLAVLLLGGLAVIVGTLDSMAAQVALGAGVAVFVAAFYRARAVFRGLRVAVFGLMLFAPALPHLLPTPETIMRDMPRLSFSIAHRVAIWQFAAERIVEKPLTGWGLESSRHFQERYATPFPETYRKSIAPDQLVDATVAYFSSQILPLHPHNGFLQIWLELGAVGALVFLGFLLWLLTRTEHLAVSRGSRAGLAALFASGLVVFLTAFSAWQSWWQGALWLIAALAVAAARRVGEADGGTGG